MWNQPVATTLREPMDAPGRPKAHGNFWQFGIMCSATFPLRKSGGNASTTSTSILCGLWMHRSQTSCASWTLSSLRIGPSSSSRLITENWGGAHGLHGKGPFAYEEGIYTSRSCFRHPDVPGGQSCRALTSHIDIAPTLLAMGGATESQRGDFAGRDLPGKNLMPVLSSPSSAQLHAAREGILFTYSALVANDAGLIATAGEAIAAGKNPAESMKASGFKPDLKKRGSVRTTFDGRYKFSRYFAPVDRNKPESLTDLYKANDVELFDLQTDPSETTNLAVARDKNRDLVASMSNKLEALIKAEVGEDNGREMPELSKITWTIDRADL